MKILHIVPTYLPAYRQGGPILSVHQLNKWLVKKGADVTVYTTNIDGAGELAVPLGEIVRLDDVKIFYFQSFFPRGWSYSLDLHLTLAKTIQEFDIVHITSVFLAASTLGAYYARKRDKPYIISPRRSLMTEPLAMKGRLKKRVYLGLIEKRNLAKAAAIHFTVEAEKEEYLAAGLPLKNSFIIPNGFDADEFKEKTPAGFFRKKFNIPADKKIVLFLGRLNWKKGLDTLIPAFKRVLTEEPRAFLVLAGGDDEGYRKQIEDWIDENNLKGNVIFTGMLLGEDKTAAFRDSQIFVLPSYSENFGMAVAEGMSQTAVVVTKGVGISPLIEKYEAGIVVNKDEGELARSILKIIGDPVLAERLKAGGRELIKREFSLSEIAGKFLKEYETIYRGNHTDL